MLMLPEMYFVFSGNIFLFTFRTKIIYFPEIIYFPKNTNLFFCIY
ncbi:hypothetical protein Mgra_00001285 [Meloidogyne graminicola]|uniref:Uncharacterized protein n=1 Tax=Meloidogyne graminicola TaxID=189291 RepID=A0A8T0A1D6_9BILA|nr:hypothetical protein Mgra_00001285 [Meloidogyne graminicola]